MTDAAPIFVGRPVLLSIDIQRGYALPPEESGIAIMDGHAGLIANAERVVAAARLAAIPVVFFQEAHRPDLVDFGRELDGTEGVHCLEGDDGTELWPTLVPGPGEYGIAKRRYSCFFGTDLEILLKGLGASTLVLIGGLTDVCIHYTFADAHQHDYRVRVVSDCVIGSTEARHEASLSAMEYLQHGARRTTSEVVEAFETHGNTNEPANVHKGAA
ncbi:MAG TPA: isochorismatase family cysteine hydrolase [Acidimicrobiales bacterium]|jgi:nicotinamidase-related amidase|nr:isochorismatase family cysteine hydrolase [Acidimicrobiales bacterium]